MELQTGRATRTRAAPRSHRYGLLHQNVVEQLAPPSVLINEDYDIVHLSEHARRFLRFTGGEPTRNLLKVAHPGIRLDLQALLLAAKTRTSDTARTGAGRGVCRSISKASRGWSM